MTPDTLSIDRRFTGVGRIKRRSGTTVPAVRRKIDRMLTALYEDGRLDILRAVRDGKITPMQVLDAYTRKTLDKLPIGATAATLGNAFGAWHDSLRIPLDVSDDHHRSLGASRKVLASVPGTVADLPEVLEQLRKTVGTAHPRTFNLARAAALAFVRWTYKRSHPLWLAVAAVEPLRVTPTKKRTPLTVQQMQGFFPHPQSDHVDALAWTMATTGMHAKELWGKWETQAAHVRIQGTKREGRVRDVPLIFPPSVPRIHRRTFEDKLRERTSRAIVPYDLRRTFANWMEAAGVPRTRRRLYLGHGSADVTDLYELHEVKAFLAEDAKRLCAHIELDPPSAVVALRVVK
jgi:integrase